MWLAIGVASLVLAGGVAYLCARLATTLRGVDTTLAKIDRQLDGAEAPLRRTLEHVGGLAGSADTIAVKVGRIAGIVEHAAESMAKTADAAQAAVTPAMANIAGIVAGVSQGAKTFFRSRGNGA